jgi:ABC-type branched-subunit amino acid transport system substrate-binding protein
MKRTEKTMLRPAAMLCATAVLIACGISFAGVFGGGDPIRIGVVAPLTGSMASVGKDIVRSARLAAAQINKGGGLLDGHKAELVVVDDACDPRKGVAAMRHLLKERVMAVVGGACSGAALPETVVTDKAGIPFIADSQTSALITGRRLRHVFRTIGSDADQGAFAASYLMDQLKAKRVAVVHDGSAYSKGLAESMSYNLGRNGGTTVSTQSFTAGTKTFLPLLARTKAARPEAVFFPGYYADAGLFIRQARATGIDVPLLGGDAALEESVITAAGRAAEGFTVTTPPLVSFLTSAAATTFAHDYRTMFGTDPGSYAPYEYDAMNILARAVKTAHSADPAKVTFALDNVYSFKGVTGTISFEPNGDRLLPVFVTAVVHDDAFQPGMAMTDEGAWTRAD